jgi:hypothetical protein
MQKANNNEKGDNQMANNRSAYHAKHLREKREAEQKQKEIFNEWQNKLNKLKIRRFN